MDQQADNGGLRFDEDKLRMDLIPPEAEEAMARILTLGAKKYAERNWERGLNWSRCYASLRRHISAWWKGEDIDPESGELHIEHALWNVMALVVYQAREIGKDDRPVTQRQDEILKRGIQQMREEAAQRFKDNPSRIVIDKG